MDECGVALLTGSIRVHVMCCVVVRSSLTAGFDLSLRRRMPHSAAFLSSIEGGLHHLCRRVLLSSTSLLTLTRQFTIQYLRSRRLLHRRLLCLHHRERWTQERRDIVALLLLLCNMPSSSPTQQSPLLCARRFLTRATH